MKKIINLFLMAFALASCTTTVIKDYEENLLLINNIKGHVESIRSETFEAEEKFGEIQKGKPTTPYFSLPVFSIISGNSFYEFTKHGKLKTRESDSEYYSYKMTLVYDNFWNLMEEVYKEEYGDNQYVNTTKYKVEKNKLESSVTYNKDGKELGMSEYVFEGDLIKEIISKDQEGILNTKIKYSYKDGIQTQSVYDGDDKLTQEYKRDIDGRTLETYVSYNDERTQVFYKAGNVFPVELKMYKANEIVGKLELSFDDNNNITEINEIDEDGDIDKKISLKYKFDNKGNWIEQAMYEDGDLQYITTRDIKYFKN